MVDREETDRLIRTALIRVRALEEIEKEGDYVKAVNEAYSIMFMAAKATLNHLGANAISHRAVASIFRKELMGRDVMSRKYQDYLRKIHDYREEVSVEKAEPMPPDKLARIVAGCKDFVNALNEVIKANPEPILQHDITDFA